MKVLILGGGGREHAIAWKLSQSPALEKLWAAPGSDAIATYAQCAALDPLDPAVVSDFARSRGVDLVLIGPEAPLAAGVSDAVRSAGILAFGPSKSASRLETSKAFAKEFMERHGIPTAAARVCATPAEARAAARSFGGCCAVKADGLAAGKGVIVCGSTVEAESAVDALSATSSGRTLIVEQRLEGPELTIMVVVNGRGYALLAPSQDHKRLEDGNLGPNTGGMGALCPAPIGAAARKAIAACVLEPTLAGLARSGLDYRGVLYIGLMMTAEGPKVLEYNARFGDPETQTVLPLLDADLLSLAADCAAERPMPGILPTKPGACVGVTLASHGYPDSPKTGAELDLSGADGLDGVLIFHAGTRKTSAGWVSSGGRVLTVVGQGPDLAAAHTRAYAAVERLKIPGLRYRRDIGAKALKGALA